MLHLTAILVASEVVGCCGGVQMTSDTTYDLTFELAIKDWQRKFIIH